VIDNIPILYNNKSVKRRTLVCIILFFLFVAIALPVFCAERAEIAARSLEERGIAPLLIAGLISMVPIFELRGGIPIGIAAFKQNPFATYLIAVCFNLIPVFPVLYFLNPVKKLLERLPLFRGFFQFLSKRAEKNKRLVERYEEFGLMLFVAVPLPVTGAWTGSLIAVLMGLNIVKSFLFIAGGVLIAGVVVTLLTMLGKIGILLGSVILLSFILVYIFNILKESK
jgi:uncharacterized membrane protein